MAAPSQLDVIAFLHGIGCAGQADDLPSIRFAEKIIAGVEVKIADWLKDEDVSPTNGDVTAAAHGVLEGAHWKDPRHG